MVDPTIGPYAAKGLTWRSQARAQFAGGKVAKCGFGSYSSVGPSRGVSLKRTIAIGAIASLLFVGAYAVSPLFGFYRIQKAAQSGDKDALEAVVDFPATREDLKEQLRTALAINMQKNAELKDNPFAGLGLMMATAMVDNLVTIYLTPQSISTMISKAQAPKPAANEVKTVEPESTPTINMRYGYVSLNRFRVRAINPEQPAMHLAFLMERRSLVSWKLIRIELPPALFE